MSTARNLVDGQFCHVYNRGVDRRQIFMDEADRFRFLCHLAACNGTEPVRLADESPLTIERLIARRGETLVDLCAYCLMDNHFHLILRIKTVASFAKFLQKLTGYTAYVNRRHARSGALFQGRAKSRGVIDHADLANLVAYVNLNPIGGDTPALSRSLSESEILTARSYRYSSLADYLGTARPESALLDMGALPRVGFGAIPFDICHDDPDDPEIQSRDWISRLNLGN
jgi:REP element-mobilizing transposase RayT